ncbi:hypothetical protein HanIR_Chr04g0183731 [Helianthus annuus]|nr:hypothetical protein HanIR_Chr04g0183731 [Helianthus annuus]
MRPLSLNLSLLSKVWKQLVDLTRLTLSTYRLEFPCYHAFFAS